MDSWTQWTTTALIVATALGTAGILGQFANQRRQRKVAEAEAHVQQANAWAALDGDWNRCVIVVTNRHATFLHGIPAAAVAEFLRVVERYRTARVAWNHILSQEKIDDAAWASVSIEERQAREGIEPYAQSVRRVVMHLAQISSLILRKQLSIDAVYGALGPACLRVDGLTNVLKMGYAHNGGCVAPDNMERHLWASLTAEQVVARLGWGNFLDVARGTAERVALLLDLMKQHALRFGDLTEGPTAEHEQLGTELSDIDRLGLAWRAARPFGRMRAIGITVRLAAAGRAARRRYWFWDYPAWARWFWNKVRGASHGVTGAGPVGWLLDFFKLPFDVMRAARKAKSIRDIRWLEMPESVSDRLVQDANMS